MSSRGCAFHATAATEEELLAPGGGARTRGARADRDQPGAAGEGEGGRAHGAGPPVTPTLRVAERRAGADAAAARSPGDRRSGSSRCSCRSSSASRGSPATSRPTGASTAGRTRRSASIRRITSRGGARSSGTDEWGPGAVGENFTVDRSDRGGRLPRRRLRSRRRAGRSVAAAVAVPDPGAALGPAGPAEARRAQRPQRLVPARAAHRAGGSPAPRSCCRSGRIPSGRFSA